MLQLPPPTHTSCNFFYILYTSSWMRMLSNASGRRRRIRHVAGRGRRGRSWRRAGRRCGGARGELDRYSELNFPQKVNWPKCSYQPKLAGMTETRQNGSKFFPRWSKGVSCSGLHTNMRFLGRSGRNGTVYTTLILTSFVS